MLKFQVLKINLSKISKLCIAALLLALTVIFQKVLAINYISFVPFVRISFGGPAMIILASILLGPWYGLGIGLLSDIIGYFIFDPKNNGFFPQITAIYALLGLVAYFIFYLVSKIKNKKLLLTIQIGTFIALFLCSTFAVFLLPEIRLYGSVYVLKLWHKILISCLLFIFLTGLTLFTVLYKGRETKTFTTPQLTFSLFLIEIFVMVLFGSIMKGSAFGFQTYGIILLTQILTLFFNVPFNTFILSILISLLEKKYIKSR